MKHGGSAEEMMATVADLTLLRAKMQEETTELRNEQSTLKKELDGLERKKCERREKLIREPQTPPAVAKEVKKIDKLQVMTDGSFNKVASVVVSPSDRSMLEDKICRLQQEYDTLTHRLSDLQSTNMRRSCSQSAGSPGTFSPYSPVRSASSAASPTSPRAYILYQSSPAKAQVTLSSPPTPAKSPSPQTPAKSPSPQGATGFTNNVLLRADTIARVDRSPRDALGPVELVATSPRGPQVSSPVVYRMNSVSPRVTPRVSPPPSSSSPLDQLSSTMPSGRFVVSQSSPGLGTSSPPGMPWHAPLSVTATPVKLSGSGTLSVISTSAVGSSSPTCSEDLNARNSHKQYPCLNSPRQASDGRRCL